MTTFEFNEFCKTFAQTTYIVQWGNSHVWKVGGKVFAIHSINKQNELGFTFKTSELNFYFLHEKEFYRPAPYLASRGMKWIQQFCAPSDFDEELRYYITESYRIVGLGLSKKKQQALGLQLTP